MIDVQNEIEAAVGDEVRVGTVAEVRNDREAIVVGSLSDLVDAAVERRTAELEEQRDSALDELRALQEGTPRHRAEARLRAEGLDVLPAADVIEMREEVARLRTASRATGARVVALTEQLAEARAWLRAVDDVPPSDREIERLPSVALLSDAVVRLLREVREPKVRAAVVADVEAALPGFAERVPEALRGRP